MTTLSILDGSGDTKLSWDHSDPEQCAAARQTVLALKEQGYTFFLIDGTTPADEIAAGKGAIVVRKLTADEVAPLVPDPEPAPVLVDGSEPLPVARRRGRPPKQASPPDQNVVAVRPMRGG